MYVTLPPAASEVCAVVLDYCVGRHAYPERLGGIAVFCMLMIAKRERERERESKGLALLSFSLSLGGSNCVPHIALGTGLRYGKG